MIRHAQFTYRKQFGTFAPSLEYLRPASALPYDIYNPDKLGYRYEITYPIDDGFKSDRFAILASPLREPSIGEKHFYTIETGEVWTQPSRDGTSVRSQRTRLGMRMDHVPPWKPLWQ